MLIHPFLLSFVHQTGMENLILPGPVTLVTDRKKIAVVANTRYFKSQ